MFLPINIILNLYYKLLRSNSYSNLKSVAEGRGAKSVERGKSASALLDKPYLACDCLTKSVVKNL